MPKLTVVPLLVLGLSPVSPLLAQSPGALSEFFEGKQVIVKMDMPGSQQGVDVYPQKTPPLDLKSYSSRIKKFGTALRTGDSVMITKIKVKDQAIEFQLGGGGYGTFFDDTDDTVYIPATDKSNREKDLERQLKNETDPEKRKRLRRQLDDLRDQRERRDQRNQVIAAEASAVKQQRIDAKRVQGGSRFNIRYSSRIPSNELTPQSVMAALAQYVTFPPEAFGGAVETSQASADPVATLQKGMTFDQVESLLGKPKDKTEKLQDGMKMTSCTFQQKDSTVAAEFVNGVLVRYTISSH